MHVRDPLSGEDRAIPEFVRARAPLGGPGAAEIVDEFGMDPGRFYHNLERVLATTCLSCLLPPAERAQVMRVVKTHPC